MRFSLFAARWLIILSTLAIVITAQTDMELSFYETAHKCAQGNNQFALNLYNVLRDSSRTGRENLIISPFSIRTVMAMLQSGAERKTAEEIRAGMNFPENNTELFEGYRAMLKYGDYTKSDFQKNNPTYPVTLEQANRIYIKRGFPILENFQSTLKHVFQSPISQIDFSNGKKAATEINGWVSDRTHQKIPKLVESDSLNNFTRMVLVNALYFKGPWENKFHGRLTQRKAFHISEGRTLSVDMMQTEDYFSVANVNSLDARAIILPYQQKRFQMVILLPNRRFGLEEMEKKLKTFAFTQIHDSFFEAKARNVILSVPKFSLESSFDLIETMKRLNMNTLFSEKEADFSGIAKTDESLFVSKLVQKAFLSVEEQGSEAGAATYGAIFTPLSIGPTVEEEVTVDHPFMGYIYDSQAQLVLFMFRKTKF